ncbi:MAG: fasciclin domain-containing protein, partial [Gemmataceae bacterium]|nr:fasciclin domain-containing protein [Gemmataceae bacterium]
ARVLAGSALAALILWLAPARASDEKDVVDTVAGSKNMTILATAIKEAGLDAQLRGKGPFTLFAPTDAAFKKLGDAKVQELIKDKEWLRRIVLAHVVEGKEVVFKDPAGLDGADVNGFKLRVQGEKATVGEATVVRKDVRCTNGMLHEIDTVLIPSRK